MAGSSEFAAVVMAIDEGPDLFPLSEDIPPCLLPVNNRPILSFQLELLQHSGFSEIIVLTLVEYADRVNDLVRKLVAGGSKLVIHVEPLEDPAGTADALRTIKHRLATDFVLISSDLVTDQVSV